MSNSRFFLLLLILNWNWTAFGSEQQSGKPVLVIEVYSVTIDSNEPQQHAFFFWTDDLKKGPTSQNADSRILHEEYPLGKPFDISKEAKVDRGHGNMAIVGHVETGTDDGAYKITFSQLGHPPAYEGKTSLRIRPKDRRVLILPAIDLGEGQLLETVVVLAYKSEESRDGEKSRFERP